jgi:hypothetical protein
LVTKEGEKSEARKAIREVYKYCNSEEAEEKYYQHIKRNCSEGSSGLTYADALCNAQYRKSTWVNVGYIIFHELTGINVVMLYSTTMLQEMHKAGGGISPRGGTYLVGLANVFGACCSVYCVKTFGRKTLLIWGHLGIAVCHTMVGIFNNMENNNGVVAMIMCFIIIYADTSGSIAWAYAAETVIDVAMGICLLTLWGTVTILSQVCPILMDPSSIGPSNMFFILSGLSVIGATYVIFIMKETQGLTDREKKLLFTP